MIRAVTAIAGGLVVFLLLALLLSVVSDGTLSVGFNPASSAPAIAARGKQEVDFATARGVESDARQRELAAAQARQQEAELWHDTRAARAARVQAQEHALSYLPWALVIGAIILALVPGIWVGVNRLNLLWETVNAPVVREVGNLTVANIWLTATTIVTDKLLPGYSLVVQDGKVRVRGLNETQQIEATRAAAQIGVAHELAQARIGTEEQGARLECHRINAGTLVQLVEAAGGTVPATARQLPNRTPPQLEPEND